MAKKSKKNISYDLHEKAKLILPILVQLASARSPITYGHLAGILPNTHHRNLNYPLGSIGTSLTELNKKRKFKIPPIQCLVINQAKGLPGEGIGCFLRDFLKKPYDDMSKVEKEKEVNILHEEIYDFKDWSDVLNSLEIEEQKGLFASDISTPPDRIKCIITRIVRDTKLAQKIKNLYNYQCQICSHYIELPDNQRYAEAHHIKPLGKPHNGPDKKDNIICLCPNCHAAVDLGAIKIRNLKLNKHTLNKEYIEYHNQEIYRNP